MKRGGPEHPKTLALAAALGIPLAQAVGHLEALFHFTAKYAPRGDVGRWPNDAIAKRTLWDEDAARHAAVTTAADYVGALVETSWLHEHAAFRLVVHGWAEHCDDATQKSLFRSKNRFWDGCKPYARKPIVKTSRVATKARQRRDGDAPAVAGAVPLPSPEPDRTQRAGPVNGSRRRSSKKSEKTPGEKALERAIFRGNLFKIYDDCHNLCFQDLAKEIVSAAAGDLFGKRGFRELGGAGLEGMRRSAWELLLPEVPEIERRPNRREYLVARVVELAVQAGQEESRKATG